MALTKASSRKLSKGQRVWVASEHAGSCSGVVLATLRPGELPAIPEAPTVPLVAACMRDLGIRQVAIIEHLHNGEHVTFAAAGDGRGNWQDLQHRPLRITAMQPAKAAKGLH